MRRRQKQDGERWDVGADVSMGIMAPAYLLLLRGKYFTADHEVPGSAPGALSIAPFPLHSY